MDIGRCLEITNWTGLLGIRLEGRIRISGVTIVISLYWRNLYIRATTLLLLLPSPRNVLYLLPIHTSFLIVIVTVHGAPWSHFHSPRHSLAVTIRDESQRRTTPPTTKLVETRTAETQTPSGKIATTNGVSTNTDPPARAHETQRTPEARQSKGKGKEGPPHHQLRMESTTPVLWGDPIFCSLERQSMIMKEFSLVST